jgi:hypothetical protein
MLCLAADRRPVLRVRDGGENLYNFDLWVAPYPADGELHAACVWADQDISLTATALRLPTPDDIASRVLRIWD